MSVFGRLLWRVLDALDYRVMDLDEHAERNAPRLADRLVA